MKVSSAVSLSLHLLSLLIFGLVGASFLILPFFPKIGTLLYLLLTKGQDTSFLIGASLVAFSLLIALTLSFFCRKSYVTLEMKGLRTDIDPAIVRSCFEEYWRQCFKGNHPKIDISLDSQGQIEIITEGLPPDFKTEENLELLEKEVGFLLAHHLGYKKKFYFSFKI